MKGAKPSVWTALARGLRGAARLFLLIWDAVYFYHYNLGVFVLRKGRRILRFLARVTRKPRRWLRYMWLMLVARPVHRFFRRMWRLVTGLPCSFIKDFKTNYKKPLSMLLWLPRSAVRWLRDYREEWYSLGRLVGPIVAAYVLVTTVQTWTSTEFCLTLTYRDKKLGVIEHASVYDEAASLAMDRVTNEDDSFTVDKVPTLTLTIKGGKTPLSAAQLCDAILRNSGDAIAEAMGLYIDGDFIGAMEDADELQELLDGLKSTVEEGDTAAGMDGPTVVDRRVEFVQDVVTEEGLFPISTMRDKQDLLDELTRQTVVERIYVVQPGDVFGRVALKHDMTSSELMALNPQITDVNRLQVGDELVVQRPQTFLQVKEVLTTRDEDVVIDYKTQTIYNSDMDEGTSKVITKGQEGRKDVVTEITYLDGFETGRVVISEKVTKKPVTKVVEVGTKKVAPFYWPVPVCRRVYQGYHGGHRAWDISSGGTPVRGTPCMSADSGTVIYARTGWNGGYGYLVKIRHSNGLITVYAHLDAIHVREGQRVSRGQQIGKVGNTGRSTGPHLHFEVIRNGVKVNPSTYFNSKDWYS